MSDFYITLLTADIPDPIPPQSVLVTEYGLNSCYLYTSATDPLPDWPVGTSILAAWEDTGLQTGETYDTQDPPQVVGSPTYPIQSDYWDFVRPLGNEVGRATGPLRTLRWQGHPEVRFAITDTSEYPSTNEPFGLEIQRQDYGSTALPWDIATVYATGDFATSGGMWRSLQDGNVGNTPFGGSPFWEFINQSGFWGWVVFMLSDDPNRAINARAIGIYTDPECTIFQYTTGAFINDNKYGDVFYTECPPGNRVSTNAQVNFALLLGAAQEGWMNLPEGGDGETNDSLYWAADQP
jgi:hypothetical protein